MNLSVNPCDNFYEYACGGWVSNFSFPDNEVEWSVDDMINKYILEMKQRVLEEEIKPDDIVPLQIEKKLHKSCMNLEAIEDTAEKPLLQTINAIGGWPLIMEPGEWDSDKYSWERVLKYYANLTGYHSLFSIDIDYDIKNSSRYILYLGQPDQFLLTFSNKNKYDAKSLNDYVEILTRIVDKLSSAQNMIPFIMDMTQDIRNLTQFAKKLHRISIPGKSRFEFTRNKNYMTIKELQELYDYILGDHLKASLNWLDHFQNFMHDVNKTVLESNIIVVEDPRFIKRLASLLSKTSNRTIVNYIHWIFIAKILPYLNKDLSDEYSTLNGLTDDYERWRKCLDLSIINLGSSYTFVKQNITDEIINEVKSVATTIRNQLSLEIQKSSWMNSNLKNQCIKKLNKMKTNIAYPDFYNNLTLLNNYYNGLHIGESFYDNIINSVYITRLQKIKSFTEKSSIKEWTYEPTEINAYYHLNTNSFTILAAEITTPLFDLTLPKSVNYGMLGFVIGHEMSHGFDTNGRKFNEDGDVLPWWPKDMIDVFEMKKNCIIDQYSNYSTDAKLTVDEDIADNMGITAAYNAYKTLTQNKQDKKLPGLEHLTPDQLFFISFATNFCLISRDDLVLNDVHSSANLRVNGVVENSSGFDKAFKCERNKESKCSVWK